MKTAQKFSRNVQFEEILNFRDLGGYRTADGKTVARRRLYRSGELQHMSASDKTRLKAHVGLKTIIDLRSTGSVQILGVPDSVALGVNYFHLPLGIITDGTNDTAKELFQGFTSTLEIYMFRVARPEFGRRIVEALEIIASPSNHPLVFHCNAGKDRSGILAAIILSVLSVEDRQIVEDYCLTGQCLRQFIEKWNNDPRTADVHKNLPSFQLEVLPETIIALLAELKKRYGSTGGYLATMGADSSLTDRLKQALLVLQGKV